jgi:RHS repeat-associated protein
MEVEYILGDHLGSSSLTTDKYGNKVSEIRYKPWGEIRSYTETPPANAEDPDYYQMTRYTFTGQYSHVTGFGLMFYNARWYDSSLGRFAQADTIVPGGVQGYDRYAYANNNPVRFNDPSGHSVDCGLGDAYCSVGEYTPGGLMHLYEHNDNEKLNKEINDYLRTHSDYDDGNDPYMRFTMGDNRQLRYKNIRLEYWKSRLKESGICESFYFCEDEANRLFSYYDEHDESMRTEMWDSSRISKASVTLDIVGIPLALVGVGGVNPTTKTGSTILFLAGILDSSVSLGTANHPMKQLISAGSYIPFVGAIFDVNLLVWDLNDGTYYVPYTPPIHR